MQEKLEKINTSNINILYKKEILPKFSSLFMSVYISFLPFYSKSCFSFSHFFVHLSLCSILLCSYLSTEFMNTLSTTSANSESCLYCYVNFFFLILKMLSVKPKINKLLHSRFRVEVFLFLIVEFYFYTLINDVYVRDYQRTPFIR